ncbi:subtilase family protein [Stackebrandtia albiflava]|uniref:Subtilase family protein n=1 Tax=Stackebrandtia albiflava TaxID=406432 RepID=A0A562V1M9_9ACTN|nr:S8 family serine peptidase [Stackebrandtia albiflava]TWJ11755.1 subtilase family protein [Stackebrandtia albiflava]
MDEGNHNDVTPGGTGEAQRNSTVDSGVWGPLATGYAVLAGAAIVLVTGYLEFGVWLDAQSLVLGSAPVDMTLWPGETAVAAALALLIASPLLAARRFPALRTVGATWAVAAVLMGLLGVTRLVAMPAGALQLAVQAVCCAIAAAVLWPLWRGKPASPSPDRAPAAPGAFWWALCAGGVMLVPWVWAGALGGAWETVAAVAAALGFALLCGVLLGDRFWSRFVGMSGARRILGGGAAAGVALALPSLVMGGGGLNLLIGMSVPAVCFAVAALQRRTYRTGRVVAAAVAPATFGPLAYGDADEFLPLALGPDFGVWLLVAAIMAVLLAWLAGLLYGLTARKLVTVPAFAAGTAVIVAAVAGGTGALAQPGLHGEKLLVVLREQADLDGVEGDVAQRRAEVYSRLTATAVESQAPLRAELTARGLTWRPFYLVNAIEVDADLWERDWLEERSDVAAVLLSPQSRPVPFAWPVTTGGPLETDAPQPNITQVGAPTAWQAGSDGDGVVIGIADSGVDGTHPAFADRFRGGDDSWADPVNGTTEPNDPNGHGTHALGLALGGEGVGVAPGADWIGCANLPRNAGNPGDYLACLEFMLAPYAPGEDPFTDGDPSRAADVVSNSWGCPHVEGCDSGVFGPALAAYQSAGIFFVVSAGNAGPACGTASTPPVGDPGAFSVGAVDAEGRVAWFSSRGPVGGHTVPALVAPGTDTSTNGVVSALPGGGYGRMMGTSMAAPHVSGAVAVLWSAVPELRGDVSATAELLRETAAPVTGATGAELDACGSAEDAAGAGMLDVAALVRAAG